MNKILTIIIPTYNMEKYLRKCLNSLIVSEDNMQRLEVLVVNDGSKDSSSQIAHEYENKYPQIFRVIDKENGNYGSCVNRGLKEATGKYVKVLDADDYLDSESFNDFLSFLTMLDVDIIVTDYDVVDMDGRITGKKTFYHLFEQEATALSFTELLKNKKDMAFPMHAITYRLNMVQKMGYKQTEGISYTDQEWATIPVTWCQSICYRRLSIYKYLIGREGQTMADYLNVKNHKQLFQVLEKLSSYYQDQTYDNIYNVYVENKLKKVLASIYEAGLKYNLIDKEELQLYDENLKKFPKVYELAGNLKLIHDHINYVQHWRSDNAFRKFFYIWIPVNLKNLIKR